MARARAKFRDPHFWVQVTSRMHCALGDHGVQAGVWVRMRRGDIFRRASCEICLKDRYGIKRHPWTSVGDKPDVRARRAGADE